jgi:hypothetical protein
VRRGERARHADLRARQDLHRRRHLVDGRFRQHEPRSWTHDSELSCAVLDETQDEREPRDPAGLGDGARFLARETRLRLWREHLGRSADDDDPLLDPTSGFATFRRTATDLDEWYGGCRRGVRPPGQVRVHRPTPVPPHHAWWARAVARVAADPDGRPRARKRTDTH